MTYNLDLRSTGTVDGGTPILTDFSPPSWVRGPMASGPGKVAVTLTKDYVKMPAPAQWPLRPRLPENRFYPDTMLSGTTWTLFAAEAEALIAAGAAELA